MVLLSRQVVTIILNVSGPYPPEGPIQYRQTLRFKFLRHWDEHFLNKLSFFLSTYPCHPNPAGSGPAEQTALAVKHHVGFNFLKTLRCFVDICIVTAWLTMATLYYFFFKNKLGYEWGQWTLSVFFLVMPLPVVCSLCTLFSVHFVHVHFVRDKVPNSGMWFSFYYLCVLYKSTTHQL